MDKVSHRMLQNKLCILKTDLKIRIFNWKREQNEGMLLHCHQVTHVIKSLQIQEANFSRKGN